jgi:hypothetical protein
MASTFSQIKTGLDTISARIAADRAKALTAKATLTDVVADLNQLGTDNTQLVSDIDAALTATPNDVALQNAKAEKDRLVAEFNALKTVATNAANAITA